VAPEARIDPRKADRRSDLYSLGRTIAAALHGRDPQDAEPHKLPPPWRNFCETLCQYKADDRPQDADAAIELLIDCVVPLKMVPQSLDRHIDEVERRGSAPKGWPALCDTYFEGRISVGTLDLIDLYRASRLNQSVFADPAFDADRLFHAFVNGPVGAHYRGKLSTFDGVDPYGQYLRRTYSALTPYAKLTCFATLVRNAVDYHRYELMHHVRDVYASERDEAVCHELVGVLEHEDAERVIEGRGVIPRIRAA
jgi:hypothetical protein